MEPYFSSIQSLVGEIKRDLMLSSTLSHFPTMFVSPSAYETAWLAMIPQDPQSKKGPMFKGCLDWIIKNQKEGGFWGEEDQDGFPTIDALPSTLACIVALNMWAVGKENVTKGLVFIHGYSEKLLMRAKNNYHQPPRWLTIVLPGTIELAQSRDLKIEFSLAFNEMVSELEVLVDKCHNFPLMSYLEALPASYIINEQDVLMNLSENGSLFQSPSATAFAFMATGNHKCLKYLEFVVKECDNGVPTTYPFDEELIKLYIINQIQRLGLAEHFGEEIDQTLETIHKSYNNHEFTGDNTDFTPVNIYKDSLAFRLLRMHGYNVTPDKFCWFVHNQDIISHIEIYHEQYMSALYNIYCSSDLIFPEERQLEKARSYSIRLLRKGVSSINASEDSLVAFPNLKSLIDRDLNVPWMARLDHLDHRFWIEVNMEADTLWVGKASYYRLLPLQNDKLIQLAVRNYEFRQSIYRKELEELKRWSKDWGITSMGFGREKSDYCYFSIASATSLPHDSFVRMIVAKSSTVVTIADDFFDTKGSLEELQTLTQAFQRWDGNDLTSHSKKIFDVIDHLVTDISTKLHLRSGQNALENLREMWRVTGTISFTMEQNGICSING
ncbi:S-linalool synthase-like [Impatiens glandulifera]|uniref:S-linalool synthase-like n=1 Tax=Impatiens glandulifera TaxID=253017 RepID=UPI001FB0E1D7|nr:S-linalool synthase-like [Impatiens glandulifera]